MKQRGFAKYVVLLVSLLIVSGALAGIYFLTKSSHPLAMQTPTPTPTTVVTPTPVVTPLTEQNAQPTLDATQQDIQQALTQTNTDLQAEGQIKASDDTTTGL